MFVVLSLIDVPESSEIAAKLALEAERLRSIGRSSKRRRDG